VTSARLRLLLQFAAEPIDEEARQGGDVMAPLAQRRDGDWKHRQTEEEILAEAARCHGGLEVPVRRGHQPHVHLELHGSADAFEPPLLERPQDLCLEAERQIAVLVEKQRAAMRLPADRVPRAPSARAARARGAASCGASPCLRR
jgi:hypothetical protein